MKTAEEESQTTTLRNLLRVEQQQQTEDSETERMEGGDEEKKDEKGDLNKFSKRKMSDKNVKKSIDQSEVSMATFRNHNAS